MEEEVLNSLNGVAKSFEDMIFFHKFFATFFIIPFVMNLLALFRYQNFVSLNKKIWYSMPLIFFIFSVSVFSGITLLFFGSHVSFHVISMILFSILVLVGEIYRIKMLKKSMRTDENAMLKYVVYAKTLYFTEIILFVIIYAW